MAGEPSLFLVYQDFNANERTNGIMAWDTGGGRRCRERWRLRLHRPPGRARGPTRMVPR